MSATELFGKDHFADLIGAELVDAGEGWAKARMLLLTNTLTVMVSVRVVPYLPLPISRMLQL